MTTNNLGEKILNHYQCFLGDFIDSRIYTNKDNNIRLQFIRYENVFEECITYASMGISKYSDMIHSNFEIVCSIDQDFLNVSSILAEIMGYIISNKIHVVAGSYVDGIEVFDSDFCKKYNISGLYFSKCYPFPKDFSYIAEHIKMYMVFFVSKFEIDYIDKNGSEKYEDMLEANCIDIMALDRNCH